MTFQTFPKKHVKLGKVEKSGTFFSLDICAYIPACHCCSHCWPGEDAGLYFSLMYHFFWSWRWEYYLLLTITITTIQWQVGVADKNTHTGFLPTNAVRYVWLCARCHIPLCHRIQCCTVTSWLLVSAIILKVRLIVHVPSRLVSSSTLSQQETWSVRTPQGSCLQPIGTSNAPIMH